MACFRIICCMVFKSTENSCLSMFQTLDTYNNNVRIYFQQAMVPTFVRATIPTTWSCRDIAAANIEIHIHGIHTSEIR